MIYIRHAIILFSFLACGNSYAQSGSKINISPLNGGDGMYLFNYCHHDYFECVAKPGTDASQPERRPCEAQCFTIAIGERKYYFATGRWYDEFSASVATFSAPEEDKIHKSYKSMALISKMSFPRCAGGEAITCGFFYAVSFENVSANRIRIYSVYDCERARPCGGVALLDTATMKLSPDPVNSRLTMPISTIRQLKDVVRRLEH